MNLNQLTKAGRNGLTVLLEQESERWTLDMRHWKKVKSPAGEEMRKWHSDFKKFHIGVCSGTDIDNLLKRNLLTPGFEHRFLSAYKWALREHEIIYSWDV